MLKGFKKAVKRLELYQNPYYIFKSLSAFVNHRTITVVKQSYRNDMPVY